MTNWTQVEKTTQRIVEALDRLTYATDAQTEVIEKQNATLEQVLREIRMEHPQ